MSMVGWHVDAARLGHIVYDPAGVNNYTYTNEWKSTYIRQAPCTIINQCIFLNETTAYARIYKYGDYG